MKHFTHLTRCAWAVALALTACMPLNTPQPTLMPPEAPTALPTETPTAMPTATPTTTPESQLWRAWFWGVFCGNTSWRITCSRGTQRKAAFYSVLSDGSELELLEINQLPHFALPNWLPLAPEEAIRFNGLPLPRKSGLVSPDRAWVAYVTQPHKASPLQRLYVASLADQTATLLFETPAMPGVEWWRLGTICWAADSQQLHFIATHSADLIPVIYRVRLGQAGYEQVHTIPELYGAAAGVCSPNGQEIIVVQDAAKFHMDQQGLYRFNLVTGQLAQILVPYYILDAMTAPTEFQP